MKPPCGNTQARWTLSLAMFSVTAPGLAQQAVAPGVVPPPQEYSPTPGSSAPTPSGAATNRSAHTAPVPPPPPVMDPPPKPTGDELRLRIAVHLYAGSWVIPYKNGGTGGLGLQIGAQINDAIGVYYSGTGGFAGASNDRISAASAYAYNAAVAEITLGRILQLGAGPSLDSMATGTISTANGATDASGTFFGIQSRIGVAVGATRPGHRGVFMAGFEIHPTFATGVTPATAVVTIGGGGM